MVLNNTKDFLRGGLVDFDFIYHVDLVEH